MVTAAVLAAVPTASGIEKTDLAGLETYLDGDDALLVAAADGRTLIAVRAERAVVPASTLKILTALAALEILGPDYRFPTDLALDAENNLVLKGYGDPLLVSETLAQMAADAAKRLGPDAGRIVDLVVDDAYFDDPIAIPGVFASTQPYDAPNGALCANFNTVNYATEAGRRTSAEPQTPLVDFARRRIPPNAPPRGRITLTHDAATAALYAGHLLARFLADNGVGIAGGIRRGAAAPGNAHPLLTHRSSRTLTGVIARMLEFSNNFMANQILVAAGAARFGPPGTLAKGVAAVQETARKRLGIEKLRLVEGSGISRTNRITPREMDRVLAAFYPYRNLMRRNGPEFYKTGTLNGVRTRAGYIDTVDGTHVRYGVFTSGRTNRLAPLMRELRKRLGVE